METGWFLATPTRMANCVERIPDFCKAGVVQACHRTRRFSKIEGSAVSRSAQVQGRILFHFLQLAIDMYMHLKI